MAIQRALLVIADIGGYTSFMREHRFSLAHAQDTVAQLLECVIDAARPLKVAKLEGDAAFLFTPLPKDGEVAELARKVPAIRAAFLRRREEIAGVGMCGCDACLQVGELKLKLVAHVGEVAQQRVKRFNELAGMDVILLHRMLKNDVPVSEYVLMTDSVQSVLPETARALSVELQHDFEGIGATRTHFIDLSKVPVPELPRPRQGFFFRLGRKILQEIRGLPYILGFKRACESFHNVTIVD